MFVRQVADQLIAAGCKVWFAEYITFDWSYRQDDTWLKSQIIEGTECCEWGIIFSSKDYMASVDCRLELNQLLEWKGTHRILQISLDGTLLEQLKKCESIQCTPEDIMEAVDFITKRVGADISTPARPGRTLVDLSKMKRFGIYYALDTYGWNSWWLGALEALKSYMEDRYRNYNRYLGQDEFPAKWGPFLQRDVRLTGGKNSKILVNLRYGKESPAHYDAFSINFNEIKNAEQEKNVLNKLNKYAKEVHFPKMERYGVKVNFLGVHVLLDDNAFGHIALTYTVNDTWMRKVSVHLCDHRDSSSYYEFVFTFLFMGSFREYCRYTGVMDDLALSVRTVRLCSYLRKITEFKGNVKYVV